LQLQFWLVLAWGLFTLNAAIALGTATDEMLAVVLILAAWFITFVEFDGENYDGPVSPA
jgi:hypothetical protein